MRLINTETGYFEEFIDSTTAPLYAILSHTWGRQEQSYQDVLKIQQRFRELQSACSEAEPYTLSHATPSIHQVVEETGSLPGPSVPGDTEPLSGVEPARPSPTRPSIWDSDSGLSEKIREACRVAREDGYRYIWVDSSCIDKTSSSELSEAINSMFNWYRDAQICYAFLSDVPSDGDVRAKILWHERDRMRRTTPRKFRASRWFERSWTLQELIAPCVVVFLSKDWNGLGTKHSLAEVIEEITHIDRDILTHKKAVADESIAERMRWAASREATRVEDEAYSLLGIFGITMTTVYGEGRNAFQRLQEEILQRIPDRSLFAWCNGTYNDCKSVPRPIHVSHGTNSEIQFSHIISPFATSPQSFANQGGKINALSEQDFKSLQLPIEEYSPTPHGIRTKIRLIPIKSLAPNLQMRWRRRSDKPSPQSVESWYLILLGSQHASYDDHAENYLLGKLCRITPVKSSIQLLEVPDSDTLIWTNFNSVTPSLPKLVTPSLLKLVTPSLLKLVTPSPLKSATPSLLKMSIDVYLPRPIPSIAKRNPAGDKSNRPQSTIISFSPWASRAVPPGYTISELGHCPNQDRFFCPHGPSSLSLLLSNAESVMLHIQYRHMPFQGKGDFGPGALIEARIWIVSPNSTLDGGVPYASAVWTTEEMSSTLPIWYIPIPVTPSGRRWITLRLWLGISRYGHYYAHVEVAEDGHHHPHVEVVKSAIIDGDLENGPDDEVVIGTVSSTYAAYKQSRQHLAFPYDDTPLRIPEPYPDFKFTMLGSTKRALETQGYSVRLEASDGNSGNSHSSHSCSLTISDSIDNLGPTFTISIQYFHNRYTRPDKKLPQSIIVARITLESVPGQGFEGYQDGPYVVNWEDHFSLHWNSTQDPIYLSTPSGDVLALKLDLDRAWVSEYYLVVNLARKEDSNSRTGVGGHRRKEFLVHLVDPHDHINLTLPTHIRRSLQTHGYEVRFEKEDNVYRLTLSDANHAIDIEYFHDLSTGPDGQQGLTFQVHVTTSVLQGSQVAAAQTERQTVDWDAWRPERRSWGYLVLEEEGWRWNLENKDVKIAFPDGLKLRLRLSLYLVWLSEYCITVEVIPQAVEQEHTTTVRVMEVRDRPTVRSRRT